MLKVSEVKAFQRLLVDMLTRVDKNRAQLREDALRATGSDAGGSLSNLPTHLADLGSNETEEGIALGMLANEDHIVEEIEDALKRIDQDTYGTCQNCHRVIGLERLRALPYARHCVKCARKLEEKKT